MHGIYFGRKTLCEVVCQRLETIEDLNDALLFGKRRYRNNKLL